MDSKPKVLGSTPSAHAKQMNKTNNFCEHCGTTDGDIKLESSRTMYYFEGVIDSPEDPNHDIMLCRECAAAHHEYWDEMWADYYSGLL